MDSFSLPKFMLAHIDMRDIMNERAGHTIPDSKFLSLIRIGFT